MLPEAEIFKKKHKLYLQKSLHSLQDYTELLLSAFLYINTAYTVYISIPHVFLQGGDIFNAGKTEGTKPSPKSTSLHVSDQKKKIGFRPIQCLLFYNFWSCNAGFLWVLQFLHTLQKQEDYTTLPLSVNECVLAWSQFPSQVYSQLRLGISGFTTNWWG